MLFWNPRSEWVCSAALLLQRAVAGRARRQLGVGAPGRPTPSRGAQIWPFTHGGTVSLYWVTNMSLWMTSTLLCHSILLINMMLSYNFNWGKYYKAKTDSIDIVNTVYFYVTSYVTFHPYKFLTMAIFLWEICKHLKYDYLSLKQNTFSL